MTTLSGKVIGEKKPKTLWENICNEFAAQRAEFEEQDFDETESSVATEITQFSARRHTPVVYGKMIHSTEVDANFMQDFNPAISHPALVGLSLLNRPKPREAPSPPPLPDPKTSSARDYLEAYIFPTLIPAIIEMLKEAKKERCFERKRTKFNACDFLTEYLYKKNSALDSSEREGVSLHDISFVQEHLATHPRPPLPLSLLWSEEEAAVKIQSYWRGHLVRCIPEVQELREWQRGWREENADVRKQVNEFWTEQENKDPMDPKEKTLSATKRSSASGSNKKSVPSSKKE